MKLNLVFLVIGVLFSVASKLLQIKWPSKLGDFLVFPAAIAFVLAVLFTITPYTTLFNQPDGREKALCIAVISCSAVVSFQGGMLLLFGYHNKFGLLFIGLFILFLTILLYKWIL